MLITPAHRMEAIKHLRRRDPILKRVIDKVGPFTLIPEKDRFRMLVRSIIAQQISTGAAKAIGLKLEQLVAPETISPQSLAVYDTATLRTVGLSPQKAGYILDLVQKCLDGTIKLSSIGRRTDEVVIEQLTQIKGIGRWTAQMFLIFSLGRLDVFPEDDFGVRSAIRNLYGMNDLPDRASSRLVAATWRPYATVGSWYCWRSLELVKRK